MIRSAGASPAAWQAAQDAFHAHVFREISKQPLNVQDAVELLRFHLYCADDHGGQEASMSPQGLEEILMPIGEASRRRMAATARAGGYGARYRPVRVADLIQAKRELLAIAAAYPRQAAPN